MYMCVHLRFLGEGIINYPKNLLHSRDIAATTFKGEVIPVGQKRINLTVIIGELGSRTLGFFLEMVLFLLIMFFVGGAGRKGNSLQSVFK
jgi:hypothetical protein